MRKAILGLTGLIVVLAIAAYATSSAPTASADAGIHNKGWGATPSDCVMCHRAHRGTEEMFLLQDQEGLCYSCHGNSASGSDLNVESGTDEDVDGALRGGGYGTARIDTDDPSLGWGGSTVLALPAGQAETTRSAHSIDGTAQTIWGYGAIDGVDPGDPGLASFPLSCGKCHDPHGNGNYRILRDVPAGLLHYGQPLPAFMPDLDGLLADEDLNGPTPGAPKQYSISDYWDVDYTDQWVDANATPGAENGSCDFPDDLDNGASCPGVTPTPDADDLAETELSGRQVGLWCTTCHTRYSQPTGSYETDSGDFIFAYGHTTEPEGRSSHGHTTPVTLSGSCIKCHVAHGSNAVVSGIAGNVEYPDGSHAAGAPNATQDSRLLKMNNRGVCQKCHNK